MPERIRASSLSGWFNCARMSAAKSHKRILVSKGFTDLNYSKGSKNVGNVSGTAGHAGFTAALERVIDGNDFDPNTVYTAASENLKANVNDMEWDATTPESHGLSGADFQLRRMLDAYMPIAATLKPARVEMELVMPLDTDFEFKGELDILETDGTVRDMKFGKNSYPYEAQLGGYSMLLKKHGYEPTRLLVDHTKRTARSKPQPPTVVTEIDMNTAETAADRTAYAIMEQITAFKETGDPWSFPANPSTFLCSKTWCPAHSTSFCDLGRPAKDAD